MRLITVFVLLGAIALSGASAQERFFRENSPAWPNLKVTFGLNPFSSFKEMPRTIKDAVDRKWEKVSTDCLNNNAFNGFRYLHKGAIDVGLLFDTNGIIAGIQMLLKKSEILSSQNQFNYAKVRMFQSETLNSEEIYTLTTYFVQPDLICSRGRTQDDLDKQGTGTGLFFQNGSPTDFIVAPNNRSDAIAQRWTKNNCMPMMGWHNFYAVEDFAATNCSEVRPVFLLFDAKNRLNAFGYVAFGESSSPRFEAPGATAIKAIVGDSTPQCLLDLADTVKISSMHIYFTNHPKTELCTGLF